MTISFPDISVILSAYYSSSTLYRCLASLKDQTFKRFEVILVNSSPEKKTERICSEFPLHIRFIQSEKRLFPHAARNVGIQKARGKLLVFTDPDCQADANWLETVWKAYRKRDCIIVGGMDYVSKNRLAAGIHLCKYHPFLPGIPAGWKMLAPSSNAAYPSRVLETTGLHNGSIFAGDALLSWKARKEGFEIWFEPEARIAHVHSESRSTFIRQRIERGYEFAGTRMRFESWSRLRIGITLILFPLLPLLVLYRAWRNCRLAGMDRIFWKTFDIQLAGHFFWSLGEAGRQWRVLMHQDRLSEAG